MGRPTSSRKPARNLGGSARRQAAESSPFELASTGALAWKFSPPMTKPAEVRRDALVDMLRDSAWARLVVLQAPAGFGKTTTMAQVRKGLQESEVETLWLTLD